MTTLDDALTVLRAALLDEEHLVRASATGRRRGEDAPPWRRVELRYVDLKSGRHLQVTSYDETQAHTANHEDPVDVVDQLLGTPYGSWHVETTTETHQLRVTKKGRPLLSTRASEAVPDRGHDRAKTRLLPEDHQVLRELGISDAQGRVKPTRRAKYHQVEELVRALDAALDDALASGSLREPTPEEPWRVVDLGCGNAYLTFAAHAWLRERHPVRTTGVDVKEQSRRHNTEVAERLGLADEVDFVVAGIADVAPDATPDVVLALHACDTATDDALARAVEWDAGLVLAAPCCHHDVSAQLRRATPPEGQAPLLRDGILRERLADTLTDAFRASILRRHGYRTEVVEFVESEHTPRNTLLRAVRSGEPDAPRAVREYDELVAAWPVQPHLAVLLGDLPGDLPGDRD